MSQNSGAVSYYARQKANSCCTKCGISVEKLGRVRCDKCNSKLATYKRDKKYVEKRKQTYYERKAAGVCVLCSAVTNGTIACQACRDKTKKVYRKRQSDGRCGSCGDTLPPRFERKTCHTCSVKHLWAKYSGSVTGWEALIEKLRKQEYKCTYTGELLVLGKNASIDHVLPRSRYPEMAGDPENIQWVTRRVNRLKGEMTHAEFMELVERIFHHGKR